MGGVSRALNADFAVDPYVLIHIPSRESEVRESSTSLRRSPGRQSFLPFGALRLDVFLALLHVPDREFISHLGAHEKPPVGFFEVPLGPSSRRVGDTKIVHAGHMTKRGTPLIPL